MQDAFGHPQSAVVFGGTSDIARAIIQRLAPLGCRDVVLAGRNLARLSEAGQEATSAGATTVSEVIFDGLDVTNVGDVVDRCFAAGIG